MSESTQLVLIASTVGFALGYAAGKCVTWMAEQLERDPFED